VKKLAEQNRGGGCKLQGGSRKSQFSHSATYIQLGGWERLRERADSPSATCIYTNKKRTGGGHPPRRSSRKRELRAAAAGQLSTRSVILNICYAISPAANALWASSQCGKFRTSSLMSPRRHASALPVVVYLFSCACLCGHASGSFCRSISCSVLGTGGAAHSGRRQALVEAAECVEGVYY
jgi:hypothetical protein